MKKILIYHIMSLLVISALLLPSYQWLLEGKELPVVETTNKTNILNELASFEFDEKEIILYQTPYFHLSLGYADQTFVNSLSPFCSDDNSVCLYVDSYHQFFRLNQEIIEPWKTFTIQQHGSEVQVDIYQLKSDEVYQISYTSNPEAYTIQCTDTQFCKATISVTLDEIREKTKSWKTVDTSRIKTFRTQLKTAFQMTENWKNYYPRTGQISYSGDLSISIFQSETNKNYLCFTSGSSSYYELTDDQLKEFTDFLKQ